MAKTSAKAVSHPFDYPDLPVEKASEATDS